MRTVLFYYVLIGLVLIAIGHCRPQNGSGFDAATEQRLDEFFEATRGHSGRKVAVFDGDGTVLGQTPHYLADECMYAYARRRPEKHPEVIRRIKGQSNVSLPYVRGRVEFLAGDSLAVVRELGRDCFRTMYGDKIFEPMRALIHRLQENDFEVWVVTASPEALYQGFLSDELGIPITRVIGVKSEIHGGIVTDRIIEPVPQDEGKLAAIESFIQARPLLVAGNSRGDREMIEHSAGLKMIVNPDEHLAAGQSMSIADFARQQGWLVVRIRDMPAPDFPAISSREFGVRVNKSRPGTTPPSLSAP